MKYIEIKAPAKINIGLNVLSKRVDGFHNLSTLFYPISDLYDVLTFSPSDNFTFKCSTDEVPNDESNLVVKAKNILELFTNKKINVSISLVKNIPSQAGLGGGSSDAAVTLISLNEMFKLNLTHNQLIELALELGSDVPFFIKSKPAIGTSRGEILEYVELEINHSLLIVNPKINISTKEAFNNIVPKPFNYKLNDLVNNERLVISELNKIVKNDFEEYVFSKYPEINKIKSLMLNEGAYFALMSGSGSTVYGIFYDEVTISKVINKLPKNYFYFISNSIHEQYQM